MLYYGAMCMCSHTDGGLLTAVVEGSGRLFRMLLICTYFMLVCCTYKKCHDHQCHVRMYGAYDTVHTYLWDTCWGISCC